MLTFKRIEELIADDSRASQSSNAPSGMNSEPSGCIAVEILAAYLDQALTPTEERDVERHLVRCERCREVLKDVLSSEVPPPNSDT